MSGRGGGPETGAAVGGVLRRTRSGASSHRLQVRRMTPRTTRSPRRCSAGTTPRRFDKKGAPTKSSRPITDYLLHANNFLR